MLEVFLMIIAGFGGAAEGMSGSSNAATEASVIAETPTTEDAQETTEDPVPAAPTGNFTTAGEVRPILEATRANWVAIRDFDGQDLLYFTHLEAWRCGLTEIRFSVNSAAAARVWEVEPCYEDTAQPNAIKLDGRVPYLQLPQGMISSVTVAVVYDDGEEDIQTFARQDILLP